MSRKWKKTLLILSIAIIGFILYHLINFGVFLYIVKNNPFNDRKFERSIWLSASGNHTAKNPRGPMAEDIRKNYLQIGMSKSDVRKLLGKTDNSLHIEQLIS
jgi:hypothetical protein